MNPHILAMKQQMSPQQLMAFESEAARYRKDPVLAFLLAFFLGIFGTHHFYLGRPRPGLILLLCTLSVVGLVVSLPWKIIKWFTVWGETADVNDEIEYAMLYGMQSPGQPTSQRPPIGGYPMTT